MDIKTVYSTKQTVDDVVADLAAQLGDFDTRQLIFFASSRFEPAPLSGAMQEAFPGRLVFGCSTSGEIVSGQMLSDSVVAMAFGSGALKDSQLRVIEDARDLDGITGAFTAFEQHFGTPMADMDPGEYVGLILVDGLSIAEEALIERIGDLTNVIFIGGSAGDDLKFKATHVYANGASYSNAAILVLMKPARGFTFIKTQSFNDLGKTLEITGADEQKREVSTINHKPAAQAYAEAVGTSLEEAPKRFMHNPLGLIIDEEPYVRSPQQMLDNGGMKFYCSISEGMELSLLQSTDIIEDTKSSLRAAAEELGGISGLLTFNCILRTLELREKNLSSRYGELFADIPTIGFSTYGEQYIGHLTQTATMLAFR